MRYITHWKFDKKFGKLPKALKIKVKERWDIFLVDPHNPLLDNHPLNPPLRGSRSINITGDYRAIFKHLEKDLVIFTDIGTHHQLFGT